MSASHIVRRQSPENLETPFSEIDSFTTPNERFYVRNHFEVPHLEASRHRVRLEGLFADHGGSFTLEELRAMPSVVEAVTLECAGNGRVFLVPKANGDNWELGAVSNATWRGVRLADILARHPLDDRAAELVLEGADEGEPDDTPKPPGKIHFARSIPRSKIGDVLIAYEMNGEPLPPRHGAPLRAIVPGFYGMASVKWLSRIIAVEEPFRGYFQSVDYAYWETEEGNPTRVPLNAMKPKAQIARPARSEVVPAGAPYRIFGAAWGGEKPLATVEVSVDGGASYAEATLLGRAEPHAWRLWEYVWNTPREPGPHTLMARATDAAGTRQPGEHEAKYGNYVIWHTIPIDVEVR